MIPGKLWKVDVIDSGDTHWLVLAPDAYTAKMRGRVLHRDALRRSLHRHAQVYVTHAYAWPASTVAVGWRVAVETARRDGLVVDTDYYLPVIRPWAHELRDPTEGIERECACGEKIDDPSLHRRCHLIP